MNVLDPTARSLLAEGRQLHVAVLATTGPHVTPELYTARGDDLWFLTAADTLKTRVVRRDPRLAAIVQVGSRAVAVSGSAIDYDIGDPVRLASQAREAAEALAALTSFTVRNASDLGAFARDLVTGRLPSRRPPRRVLVRLRAERSVVTDRASVVSIGGAWPGEAPAAALDGTDETPSGERDCVVAVAGGDGPVVAAGRCDAELSLASVPAAALSLAGIGPAADMPVALVVDDYTAPGPAAKRGLLVRGTARIAFDGSLATVSVEAARETTWDGVETETHPAS